MARIIIFGASEGARGQLSGLLAASGHAVYRLCASESELRRTLAQCEDGILILAGAVPGGLPEAILEDYGEAFRLLLIARPQALSACEAREVFRLSYPCSQSAVIAAVEMLSQLHSMHMPHRSESEERLVARAKRLLMAREGIGEPEAHRQLQHMAMQSGIKMSACAARLLQGGDDDA